MMIQHMNERKTLCLSSILATVAVVTDFPHQIPSKQSPGSLLFPWGSCLLRPGSIGGMHKTCLCWTSITHIHDAQQHHACDWDQCCVASNWSHGLAGGEVVRVLIVLSTYCSSRVAKKIWLLFVASEADFLSRNNKENKKERGTVFLHDWEVDGFTKICLVGHFLFNKKKKQKRLKRQKVA